MREPELPWMHQKERDRLKALHEVQKGHLRQKEASGQLGVTDRWVRKLLGRMRAEGDRGIVHRLRGRASNRKFAVELCQRAVGRAHQSCHDLGPAGRDGRRVLGAPDGEGWQSKADTRPRTPRKRWCRDLRMGPPLTGVQGRQHEVPQAHSFLMRYFGILLVGHIISQPWTNGSD